ncbi:serine O-acetyltransferase [Leptolyngbya sp. 7M]|uniref:serine O-acetyltransferase n=1 Tax=Leptolyngbya sp. 7M TaxID=2812896 RepID=UPI001B8B8B89|nr:serine O-acetyltransferase [Leptolyngbya sp. 7M]QYO67050.1 serine O-acetyltransferase [Leptolyngbya sp. 7M]
MECISSIKRSIYFEISRILSCHFDTENVGNTNKEFLIKEVAPLILGDLLAFSVKDPAAKGDYNYILNSYRCFKAVMHYRIAHAILKHSITPISAETLNTTNLLRVARAISEEARVHTAVEIHPAAKIGPRFVVDHGTGTVIGETCEIGSDCYILQGVILGASKIANNPTSKRHPTIGNNVEIGAFSRIIGPVTIGNNVFIGPGCLINNDIPGDTKVLIVNEYQIIRSSESETYSSPIEIYNIDMGVDTGSITILGKGLSDVSVLLIDKNHEEISSINLRIIEHTDYRIICNAELLKNSSTFASKVSLMVKKRYSCASVVLVNSLALQKMIAILQKDFFCSSSLS